MVRAGFRAVVAASAVVIAFAGGVEVAHACNEPHIKASPSVVGPGDTVRWTIGNVEPRAHYTVNIAGRPVAAGEAGASAPTGSFQMPDLGSAPREVYVGLSVSHTQPSETHPDGGYSNPTGNPATLHYRPPPPPPQTAPQAPSSTAPGTPEPVGGLGGAAPPKRGRPQAGPPDRPRVPDTRPGAPVARIPTPADAPGTRTRAPVAEKQAQAAPAAPAAVEARARQRSAVRARDRGGVESRALGAKAAEPLTRPGLRRPRELPPVSAAGEAARPLGRGGEVPGIVLVALSALVVLGLGALAIWVLHPRGSPPASRLAGSGPQWIPPGLGLEARSRDLLIEAELQEMIAEERARRLPREAIASRTRPG